MKLIKPGFKTTEAIDGERILKRLEYFGRISHKTEGKIKKNSAKKFLQKWAIKHKHESILEHESITIIVVCDRGVCYSEDTLILTSNGWKLFPELNSKDLIYTLTEDRKLCLKYSEGLIIQEYKGKLLNFRSSQVDLKVTPEHKNWIFDAHKRSPKTRKWKFLRANEMKNKAYKFYKSCEVYHGRVVGDVYKIDGCKVNRGFYVQQYEDLSFQSDLFFKLVGIWMTDGCISFGKGGNGNRISIVQKKEKNRLIIERLLEDLNIDYYISKFDYRLKCPQFFKWLVDNFILGRDARKSYYIRIPRWIMRAEKRVLEWIIEGIILGDGTVTKDGRIAVYTASYGFALDIVELTLKLGKAANIGIDERYKEVQGRTFIHKVPTYIVRFINKTEHYWRRDRSSYGIENYVEEEYDGPVYSVVLPKYHRLYVMRNGKACWSGNSHEWVRHRIASYTQESTRYCNYKGGVSFIIPPWIYIPKELRNIEIKRHDREIMSKLDAEIREKDESGLDAAFSWIYAMMDAEKVYLGLLDKGWIPQQARSVLPNSLKTEFAVTKNIRAWRHFFTMRCANDAHPQIREISLPLLDYFHEKIPVLFDDLYLKFCPEEEND